MFAHFTSHSIDLTGTSAFCRIGGSGPPLVLLHGFPETHRMWRDVAPHLTGDFTVVCPDLRGYGESGCPASDAEHTPYSKRAMATDVVELLGRLGFDRFGVVGHDRGGRVAYRMALDHPDRIDRLALLDIIPTEPAWSMADARFTLAFWPWSLLAQPAPLAERILVNSADAILDDALGGWGTPAAAFPPDVRAAYLAALRDPAHAHAICEEYRAAAALDRAHDRDDRQQDHRIECPTLALWSASGGLAQWYHDQGGPIGIWREYARDVTGRPVAGGHFFPEEYPVETAEAIRRFWLEGSPARR